MQLQAAAVLALAAAATALAPPTSASSRRSLLGQLAGGAAAVAVGGGLPGPAAATTLFQGGASRSSGYEVRRTDGEWAEALTPTQMFVLRNGGTEPRNSSPLVNLKGAGTFSCAGCGTPLFESAMKFDSGTGWPSFAEGLPGVAVEDVGASKMMLVGAELRCGTVSIAACMRACRCPPAR